MDSSGRPPEERREAAKGEADDREDERGRRSRLRGSVLFRYRRRPPCFATQRPQQAAQRQLHQTQRMGLERTGHRQFATNCKENKRKDRRYNLLSVPFVFMRRSPFLAAPDVFSCSLQVEKLRRQALVSPFRARRGREAEREERQRAGGARGNEQREERRQEGIGLH
jgi:hypothetical protein